LAQQPRPRARPGAAPARPPACAALPDATAPRPRHGGPPGHGSARPRRLGARLRHGARRGPSWRSASSRHAAPAPAPNAALARLVPACAPGRSGARRGITARHWPRGTSGGLPRRAARDGPRRRRPPRARAPQSAASRGVLTAHHCSQSPPTAQRSRAHGPTWPHAQGAPWRRQLLGSWALGFGNPNPWLIYGPLPPPQLGQIGGPGPGWGLRAFSLYQLSLAFHFYALANFIYLHSIFHSLKLRQLLSLLFFVNLDTDVYIAL